MKKLILSVLAIAAMTSCTKSSVEEIDPNAPVEIKMNAGIETSVSIGRSAVNSLSDATRTDFAFIKAEGIENDVNLIWDSSPLTTTVDESGNITFTPILYYNPDAAMFTYFIGIYPKSAGTISDGELTFSDENVNTGQTDIMYAAKISGNKNTAESLNIKFEHLLSQLKFKFTKGSSFGATNAIVTSITLKGTKIPSKINLSTGVITYDAAKDIVLAFTQNNTIGNGTSPSEVVMIDPASTGIKADITMKDGEKTLTFTNIDITVTPKAGESNEIELKFEQKTVTGQASITPWETGQGGTGTVI